MNTYCVGDAMTVKPIAVPPNFSLQEAAVHMREHDVGSVLVRKGDELLGILTHWDMVHRAMAEGMDVATTQVHELMIQDLVTVHPSMDVFDALRLMREADIRHLPVLEQEKVVGFITMKDILKIQPQLFELIDEKYEISRED